LVVFPKTEVLPRYAVSYLRVSTAKQTEESKTGIKRQEQAYENWLAAHPEYKSWTEKFQDLGISGRGDNRMRGALSKFVEKAERGEFPPNTCLVVENASRLCRSETKEGLRLIIELFDMGFSVAFTDWGGEILTDQQNMVFMQLSGAFAMANLEVEEKRSRVKGYHVEKIERFKNKDFSVHFKSRKHPNQKCFYPCWLDFDDETKSFSFNKHAVWVRLVFEWAPFVGASEIAKRLYNMGYRSLRNRKKGITKDSVVSLINNRTVLGEFQAWETSKTKEGKIRSVVKEEVIPYQVFFLQ